MLLYEGWVELLFEDERGLGDNFGLGESGGDGYCLVGWREGYGLEDSS